MSRLSRRHIRPPNRSLSNFSRSAVPDSIGDEIQRDDNRTWIAKCHCGREVGLDPARVTENQLASIPGIGRKNAWALISARAKATSKGNPIHTHQEMFEAADIVPPAMALDVFEYHSTGSQ